MDTESIVTILGSTVGAFAAVRVQIWWIVKTLDRHEGYHESHFRELALREKLQ